MTLAARLHELIHSLPMSYAQTALLSAQYTHWNEEGLRMYVRAMPRAELELAFVTLARTVATYPGETEGNT